MSLGAVERAIGLIRNPSSSLRSVSLLSAANAAVLGLGVIQSVVVARYLGPTVLGRIAVTLSIVVIATKLVSFRMNEVVVKFLAKFSAEGSIDECRAVIAMSLLLEGASCIVAFLGVWLLIPLIGRLYGSGWIAPMLRVYIIVILLNFISETSTGSLQFLRRFRTIAASMIAGGVVSLVGVSLAYVFGWGSTGTLLGLVAGEAVRCAVLSGAALLGLRRRFGSKWFAALVQKKMVRKLKEAWLFSVNTNVGQTASMLLKNIDQPTLAYLNTAAQAGYFKLATSAANLAVIPVNPMVTVFYPKVAAQAAANDFQGLRRTVARSTRLAATWIVPAALGVLLLAWLLLPRLWGPAFSAAWPVLAVLLVGLCFDNILFWTRPVLLSLGHSAFLAWLNIGLLIPKIGILVLLAGPLGAVGAAVAFTTFNILGNCACLLMFRRHVLKMDSAQMVVN